MKKLFQKAAELSGIFWRNTVRTFPALEKHRIWFLPTVIALTGTGLLYHGLQAYKERLGYGMKAVAVAVTTRALSEGHVLTAGDLSTQNVAESLIPLGVYIASDIRGLVGLRVIRQVARNAMLLTGDVDSRFTPYVPARKIAKDYRALGINVNELTSAGQSIRGGDHVDLISTLKMPGETEPTSMTLLQNVTVLNVGTTEQHRDGENYASVTLMVLPKEANLITLAAQYGKLTLALRNPEDIRTPQDLPVVNLAQMIETAFRNSIQDERNHSAVQIIRGGKLSLEPSLP